jgi:hypothetical protein
VILSAGFPEASYATEVVRKEMSIIKCDHSYRLGDILTRRFTLRLIFEKTNDHPQRKARPTRWPLEFGHQIFMMDFLRVSAFACPAVASHPLRLRENFLSS